MAYFLDTSAVAKLYFDESNADLVRNLVGLEDVVFISALTNVEMTAAVEKSKRERRINSPLYRTISTQLEWDLLKAPFRAIAITVDQLAHAKQLVRRRQLRAPDAIQLASALETAKRVPGPHEFLSFDRALSDAARLEGLKCAAL